MRTKTIVTSGSRSVRHCSRSSFRRRIAAPVIGVRPPRAAGRSRGRRARRRRAARPARGRRPRASAGRARSGQAARPPPRRAAGSRRRRRPGSRTATRIRPSASVVDVGRPRRGPRRRDELEAAAVLPRLRVEPEDRPGVLGEQVLERSSMTSRPRSRIATRSQTRSTSDEDVGREDDRRLAAEPGDQVEQVAPALRVERADGLVEEHDSRAGGAAPGRSRDAGASRPTSRRSGARRHRADRRGRACRRPAAGAPPRETAETRRSARAARAPASSG